MKRHVLAATGLAVTMVIGLAAPAYAHSRRGDDRHSDSHDNHHWHHGHGHGHDGEEPGTVTVVADNLNNPRQVAVNDGAVYVAEAGTGGNQCFGEGEQQACVGLTGSVTRVDRDGAERVQTGLLSVASPEGDIVGLDSLAFRHDRMYGVVTGTCDVPPEAPPELTAQLGKVLKLEGGTDFEAVGDPASVECTQNPDGQAIDTDPYGIAVIGRWIFVADAAGNDIVKIDKHTGEASVAAVLSTTGQPVPTSLAVGPDGNLYIGTLNFEGGPQGAIVYKYDVESGELSDVHHRPQLRLQRRPVRERVLDRLRRRGSVARRRHREDPVGRPCRRPPGHRCRLAALPDGCRVHGRRAVRLELGHRHRSGRRVRSGCARSAGQDRPLTGSARCTLSRGAPRAPLFSCRSSAG
jgi:hypothetical protein